MLAAKGIAVLLQGIVPMLHQPGDADELTLEIQRYLEVCQTAMSRAADKGVESPTIQQAIHEVVDQLQKPRNDLIVVTDLNSETVEMIEWKPLDASESEEGRNVPRGSLIHRYLYFADMTSMKRNAVGVGAMLLAPMLWPLAALGPHLVSCQLNARATSAEMESVKDKLKGIMAMISADHSLR